MDTMSAFWMGQANRNKPLMVFDWDKAASLIKEIGAKYASAGLSGDWEYTGGSILRGGVPVDADDTYTYLASTWATPQLYIDGDYYDCYRMEREVPEWGSDTYWPESALKILEEE